LFSLVAARQSFSLVPNQRPRAAALIAAGLSSLLWMRDASAYCRTTTCDPATEDCGVGADGCATRGEPLFWPDACVTYAVQRDGSQKRGISAYETDQVMQAAFRAWLSADCPGGGHPSMGVVPLGGTSCDQVEFNPPLEGRALAPNANIVMFRDDSWPYPEERYVIARTSITFDPATGAIYDADIELNSSRNAFSVSDTQVSNDLQSVLTHEVGHFLGLDHTRVPHATMLADYALSDLGTRTLSSDDEAGICSIYAPDPDRPAECPGDTGPRHGFSRDCGTNAHADAACLSLTGTAPHGSTGLGWCWLALIGLWRRRRA
jgi:hypothetical protein